MNIAGYLDQVRSKFETGQATEHSYRAALEGLFQSIDPAIEVINEPKRSEGGMPDFLFQRDGVAFGWAEAKDIDKDVIKLKGYSVEQRKRYENAYPNLIYTNGVDFEFIREGEVIHHTSIADFMGNLGGLQPLPEKYDELERQLKLFAEQKPISIKSAQKLAEMMAGKAAIIKDEVGIALADDPEFRSGLGRQFNTFKDNLLPNLTPGEFADIYAETITYGMFAARLHDQTLDTFSRQEALELLPKSNPFLRGLFQFIAGYDIPDRLRYVVDDLAEVLRASDPHSLFTDFGKFTARNDPFIHFYETFLAAYNPKKRKARGVWYTPEPVVDFIVRAVDDVLKTEFGLPEGLADTSKVTVDWDTGETKNGKPVTIKKDVHRVQILDPATGTGTFLAKAVQTIADQVKGTAPGLWSSYVEEHLLPRLHGFELLMASYAMCHMKLDMQLTESGYKPSKTPPRLSVWLTNALEPAEREVKDLFFQQLADEARGASEVKRQTPIMCVIGNPPYSGESENKGDHIMKLMEAYKKEPGGKEKLKERNPKWINDDYVKFIRMSEDVIAKNPSGGVLGFITNHGYLDNPTFRGMRWHLLKTFDKIWVLDLHGNSKKKEVSPDGSPDKNVFDIQQGVALIVAVRKSAGNDELAEVMHGDLWGSRKAKSDGLRAGSIVSGSPNEVTLSRPFLAFVDKDHEKEAQYSRGFSPKELFSSDVMGFQTHRDAYAIGWDKAEVSKRIGELLDSSIGDEDLRNRYGLKDNRDWKLSTARETLTRMPEPLGAISSCAYRLFDSRVCHLDYVTMDYPRTEFLQHIRGQANLMLGVGRQGLAVGPLEWALVIALEVAADANIFRRGGVNCMPLYLYPDENADQADALAPTERTLNLDPKLYAKICKAAGIDAEDQAGPEDDFRAATGDARPSEVKVFDYIYGVLHSPDFRETFAEFLKIDFPRIPYPASPEVFAHVSEKGEALRRLHLMEAQAICDTPFPFDGQPPEETPNEVAAKHPRYESATDGNGRVYINGKGTDGQYFDGVPRVAWEFYIGGYQPAQKWLKDRKGRALSFDDIRHYQSIIKILIETDRIMKEIKLPLDSGKE
jgi:Type ISP C-terminal specificity domain/Eco57I restriction-modification methylase